MAPGSITLQPSSPDFKPLQDEILSYLETLETVEFSTETRPTAGGAPGVEEQVFGFVMENAGRAVELAAAIMVLVSQVQAYSQRGVKKPVSQPDHGAVTLEIGDRRIDLPASKSTRREFFRIVDDDLKAYPQAGKAGKRSQR